MLSRIEPGEIAAEHPVAMFHVFWLRAAGDGGKTAPWASFDAADHPKILPWILLLKREDQAGSDDPDWQFTVCGTGCTELLGFSTQGKLFSEIFSGEAAAQRRQEFDLVSSGSGPLFSRTMLPVPERNSVSVFRGVFPFADDQGAVERILVVFAKENQKATG